MESITSLNDLLNTEFRGKVVRKDLTKMVRRAPTSRFMSWNICSGCTALRTMIR